LPSPLSVQCSVRVVPLTRTETRACGRQLARMMVVAKNVVGGVPKSQNDV
jgi:hypothetical protein